MDPYEKYKIGERRLNIEADSFGELLELIDDHIPIELIDRAARKKLVAQTCMLPPTLGTFPFGFELSMSRAQKSADLGVTVAGGATETAAFFRNEGRLPGATSSLSGFAQLLEDTNFKDSPLSDIIHHKFMLEFDVASASGDRSPPLPGLCAKPHERMRNREHEFADEITLISSKLVESIGWQPNPDEQRLVRGICEALKPHMHVETLAVFPARRRFIRMAIAGFHGSDEVIRYLKKIGWKKQDYACIESLATYLQQQVGIPAMSLSIDIKEGDFGDILGLSLYYNKQHPTTPGYWTDSPTLWDDSIRMLDADNHGLSEKMTALAHFQGAPEMLFGKSGNILLIRGIHHMKYVLCNERVNDFKAYIFFLMCPWPEYVQSG